MIGRLRQGMVTVHYFSPGERFATSSVGRDLGPVGAAFDRPPLSDGTGARRILVMSGRLRIPAVLYWPDGRDPAAVDALVARQVDPRISMAGAVVCGYRHIGPDARDARARRDCPHRFTGLVWEPTIPVPGVDPRHRPAPAFVEECPKCSLKLMPDVLAITGEVDG